MKMKKKADGPKNDGVGGEVPRDGVHDALWKRIFRAGLVIVVFLSGGMAVGMGFFAKPVVPPEPASAAAPAGTAPLGYAPAILGAMITDTRPDGQEWQTMVLSGRFNQDLDGVVHMSLYQEPAEVLRARFEAEVRRDGWKDLHDRPDTGGKMEFYHSDGRVRVISIEEYPNDLRSVTIFDGKLARRGDG